VEESVFSTRPTGNATLLSVRQPATTSLTKHQLVVEISRVLELPLKEAHGILDAILESMVRALQSGDKVEIRGFGSFNTRLRGGRIGRNPKTGAKVAVPAKRILYFALSKDLKTLLNVHSHAVAPKTVPPEASGI
jgi:integration host factor subunit beta